MYLYMVSENGKTFISFEERINLENPKFFSNPVLDCIKVRLFIPTNLRAVLHRYYLPCIVLRQ